MMSVENELPAEYSLIDDFVDLVDASTAGGVLRFDQLESGPFMQYWKNLIIYRHEPDISDFRVILFGTEVAGSYGEDWTGQLLSTAGFEKGYEAIYRVNLEIMSNGKRIPDTGTLEWQGRDYRSWHEIKMPLKRNGEINEVLVYMCFS